MLIESDVKGKVVFINKTACITYEDGNNLNLDETKLWMKVRQEKLKFKLNYEKDVAPFYEESLIHMLCRIIDRSNNNLEMKKILLDWIENAKESNDQVWGRVYFDILEQERSHRDI